MKDPKLHEFEELVRKMREAQKSYFKHRTQHYLQLSKDLEKQVDKKLAESETVQTNLFN